MKKVILMYFILLLMVISCGEENKKEKKENLNKVCEINQIICKDEATMKTCVASDNGNIWKEISCLGGMDSRICEINFDSSVSCNRPNFCSDEACENAKGCTDGGGQCLANTNGKNICNTADYEGSCAECSPYYMPTVTNQKEFVCNDNKLTKCVSGETEADAHWAIVEECVNGCNIGDDNDSCN